MLPRINFSSKTKRIIAGRAGYQCSFPGCGKVLIGPGKENNEIICIGECAHIFSAADGGPRGKDFLTDEKIRSAENGIYLCSDHHKIIDSNAGNQYPPSSLLEFKSYHESKISRQLGNYPLSVNWIKEIILECPKFFENIIKVKLGKITHLYGTNGVGKSIFCNCIYDSINNEIRKQNPYYSIKYRLNNQTNKELLFTSAENENHYYKIDETIYPILPINMVIVYLSKRIELTHDHVKYISEYFKVNIEIIKSILQIDYFNNLSTKEIRIKITRKTPYLVRKIYITNKYGTLLSLDMCSSAELARFFLDVGIVLSRFFSINSSVLYIIDWSVISMIDEINMSKVIKCIESGDNFFQTILVSPNEIPKLKWSGWSIAKFENLVPKTYVEQNQF